MPLVAITALATAGSLALLEGALRWAQIAPLPADADNVVDPFLPYKPRPQSVSVRRAQSGEFAFEHRHNSLGFRDVEHAVEKPQGVFRIVAVGDSFTYGAGAAFEDTYLAVLERLLNQRSNAKQKVEIIKMGLPRYFPELEAVVLRSYGLRFEPDLVLVTVLPNDVLDTYLGPQAITVDTGFLISRQAARLGPVATWVCRHSHLARLALGVWVARQARTEKPLHPAEVNSDGGFHEADWRALEASLEEMQRISRAQGAEMIVVSVPQRGPWDSAAAYPEQRLGRWSRDHNAVFVPTLAAMKKAAATDVLYWPGDGHCNARGYALIAQEIFGALVGAELVP